MSEQTPPITDAEFEVIHDPREPLPAGRSQLPREPIIKDWGRAGHIVLNILVVSVVGWVVRSCVNGH